MHDLARRKQTSIGSLYHFFPDRSSLAAAFHLCSDLLEMARGIPRWADSTTVLRNDRAFRGKRALWNQELVSRCCNRKRSMSRQPVCAGRPLVRTPSIDSGLRRQFSVSFQPPDTEPGQFRFHLVRGRNDRDECTGQPGPGMLDSDVFGH
ncbi:MAG: hypothetical protein L0H54_05775 [Alcaligenaceae bacterium]|nr:hypothetical protein [Alcaligenaceae bacterium]